MDSEHSFLETNYGLTTNPFTERSGVVGIKHFFVGRDQQKAEWTKIVDSRKGVRGSSLNFIVGDYGYGKTFSLYAILEQYKKDPQLISVYVKLLREDNAPKFGVDFIQRLFSRANIDKLNIAKAKRALNKLSGLQIAASVVSEWLSGNELARQFLSGRASTAAGALAPLGSPPAIKSTDVAKEYLIAFLYAMKASGTPTLLVCVDEVEYLFSQMTGSKVGNVINTLRDLYDLPGSPEVSELEIEIANIIFFLGISQSGWGTVNNLVRQEAKRGGPVQPLLSRLGRAIELGALSLAETEALIRARLSQDRASGKRLASPLIPYTEDFVEYVFQLTRGNPREIIERCDYTLRDGIEQRIPKLTREFAQKVFESHGNFTVPPKQKTRKNPSKQTRRASK